MNKLGRGPQGDGILKTFVDFFLQIFLNSEAVESNTTSD